MEENRPRSLRPAPRADKNGQDQDTQPGGRLVYGKNPVAELLKSGAGVDSVLLAEGMAPAVASYYIALAKEAGAAVKRVHPAKLRQLTGTESHQGVAAFASEIAYAEVEDLLEAARRKGQPPFLVISDGIEDPHNLGAILRSADAFGVDGIIMKDRGNAPLNATVAKISTGAINYVKVALVTNLSVALKKLQENGFWAVASDGEAKQSYDAVDYHCPIVLLVGSEGFGLSRLLLERSYFIVKIPMVGHVNSLNASVATGILLSQISLARTR